MDQKITPMTSYKEVKIGKTIYRVTSFFSGEKELGKTLEQLAFRSLGKALELGRTDQSVQLTHFHGKAPLLLRFLNYKFIFMNLNHVYVYVKLNVSTRQGLF